MDKPPFGFRQDAEEKPLPGEKDENQTEINCTSVHESKTWTPVVQAPASPCDNKWRYC